MFKRIRAAAVRVQGLLDISKAAQRHAVTLPVQVCVVAAIKRQSPPSLQGCTLDMSASGMGLCLPGVHLEGKTLANNKFQVTLQATAGTIALEVTTACYEKMADNAGYRFGVQIQNRASNDYARYCEYLKVLATQKPGDAVGELAGKTLKAA